MTHDVLGYYQVLGLTADADNDTIKRSYRDAAKYWHPDRNTSDDALAKFQKLSEAYEVLHDEEKRLEYDLLSAVYTAANYPDLENIRPYAEGELDIRALYLQKVRGRLWTFSEAKELHICNYSQALRAQMQTAVGNWLLGWWNPKAFIKNIGALLYNWQHPLSRSETLRILLHNLVAYQLQSKTELALAAAVRALPYADEPTIILLQRFIREQKRRIARPRRWSLWSLKLVQLIIPVMIGLAAVVPLGSRYVNETELWNWFSKKSEIDYYQEVNFGGRGSSFDDVIVGKIISIPVDKSDISKLFHLRAAANIMYGPGDDFDIMKQLPQNTTVRLTGESPDNVWSRVMIDNGEMGFIRSDTLVSGIGTEIPYGSAIYQP